MQHETNCNIIIGLSMIKAKSVDGLDMIFHSNHLGPFLLTLLLLDKIKKTENSRIVNVSSFVYKRKCFKINK